MYYSKKTYSYPTYSRYNATSTSHWGNRGQTAPATKGSYMVQTTGHCGGYNQYSGSKIPQTPPVDVSRSLVMANTSGCYSSRIEDMPVTKSVTTFNFSSGDNYGATTSLMRAEEKAELQKLNERFAAYINKVRQLRQQSTQLDSTAFIQSTKLLEEEVTNLKQLYEKELNNMRHQLEGCSKEKNSLQQLVARYEQNIRDLEAKLQMEAENNRKLAEQINSMQQRINSLEQELVRARNVPRQTDDVPRLKREIEELTKANAYLKQGWDKEALKRKELEEKLLNLQKKMEFDQRVHDEQLAELRQRLDASNSTIVGLETKIRQLGHSDTNVPEMLKQVRAAAEAELVKYQTESEQNYNKNINTLKAQMSNDAGAIQRLEKEKADILAGYGDLKARITTLEGQVSALEHQKSSLEQLIKQERAQSAAQLQGMDKRFRDLQENLMIRMQEATLSREAYVPIKAEIEALKALLAEEERRLSAPVELSSQVQQISSYSTSSASPPVMKTTYYSSGPQQAHLTSNTSKKTYFGTSRPKPQQTTYQCAYRGTPKLSRVQTYSQYSTKRG